MSDLQKPSVEVADYPSIAPRSTSEQSAPSQERAAIDIQSSSATEENKEIENLVSALNATASSARRAWLIFVVLMAYLFVATATVTHKDLLLNASVKLPLLQVDIALARFFLFLPLALILSHFATLMQHAILTRKAAALNDALTRQEQSNRTHPARLTITSYFFAQNIAGPDWAWHIRIPSRIAVLVTLDLLPLSLLLFIQVSVLPLHDVAITWAHRVYVLTDILIILVLGIGRRFPDIGLLRGFLNFARSHRWSFSLTTCLCVVALGFSFALATIPDEWIDRELRSVDWWSTKVPLGDIREERTAFWPTAWLFEGQVNEIDGRSTSWLSRNLIVTDQPLLRVSQFGDGNVGQSFRGRDLRYAYLARSDLRKADFTGADLTGAAMQLTNLREAQFSCATERIQPITLVYPSGGRMTVRFAFQGCAILNEVNFQGSDLTGALIRTFSLENANLAGAQCAGVDFRRANLSGTSLQSAVLRGANFSGAQLIGTRFNNARLEGALFRGAYLVAANFDGSHLDGADFNSAVLIGASLRNSFLRGADLTSAELFGADLTDASIWQTLPSSPKLFSLSNVRGTNITEPDAGQIHELHELFENFGKNSEVARDRLISLIDDSKRKVWAESSEKKQWSRLQEEATTRDGNTYRTELATYFVSAICKDAAFLKGIVRRIPEDDFADEASDGYFQWENPRPKIAIPPKLQGESFEIPDTPDHGIRDMVFRLEDRFGSIELTPVIARIAASQCDAVNDLSKSEREKWKKATLRAQKRMSEKTIPN